jgi:hypothetical protein
MTLVLFGVVRLVPRFASRLGSTTLLVAGLLVALAGMAWLSRITAGSAYFPQIALPLVLLGAGMGAAFTPLTASGIAGVAAGDAGAASGLVNVAHQLGGSLGIGILVTVFAGAEHSAPAGTDARHELAHAVAMSVTGSAVFLALALAVVVVVMRRPAAVPASAALGQVEAAR